MTPYGRYGCTTTSVLHGISKRIQWDESWGPKPRFVVCVFVLFLFSRFSYRITTFDWFLVSEPGFFWLAGTFETFWFEVEDLKELGPFTETLRWNLSPGIGFDGRKDHPMTENLSKCLKIKISKILVDNWMDFLWFRDKTQCIRLLPTRSTQRTPQNLLISIKNRICYWFLCRTPFFQVH